jgi:carboxyl-terminal processing protease
MTLLQFLLVLYAAAGVLLLAAWRRPAPLWKWIAINGAVLTVAVVIEGSHRPEALPVIIVAIIVAALAFRRSRWHSPPLPRRHRILAAGLRYVAGLLVVLVVLLDAAFIEIFDPLLNEPIAEFLFIGPRTQDFSHDTWTGAFEKLNDHLSRAYALGTWKRINWKTLRDLTAPKIADAERTGDRAAYYLALREYLWSLNDSHVNLSGSDGGLRGAAIKGGYGLLLVRLDDSRTIAHVLTEGPAASQGMQWGATILEWNGIPIDDAVARTSVLWYWAPPATNEGKRLAQLRLLARAPIGTSATVVFRNPDEAAPRTATLVSADDNRETLYLAGPPSSFELTDTNIDWRMLPENVGYIKIRVEGPTLPQLLPDRVVQRAVAAFLEADAKGAVIDVRGNFGGADRLVPRMMGFFVDTRQFYLHTTYYDETTSQFERQESLTLWTEPREPQFPGPIAVLVDEFCASSCEGIAHIARKRAGGHVVGFHGTNGSFGMSGAEVLMPGGLTVEYPGGQSLDENGVVLLDSDWNLEGGVTPDIRVPLTMDTVRARFKDGHDVVLDTAVRILTTHSRE